MSTLRRLLALLVPFRGRVCLTVLLGVAMIACNVGLLGMAAYLISDAALRPLVVTLTLPIYIVRFAGVGRAVARYAERLSGHNLTFRLLARLMARPGEAVRRRDLVRAGWPHGAIVRENTLDAYVARLRRKLRELEHAPEIATVYGVGYKIG